MTDHPYGVYFEGATGDVGWKCHKYDSGLNFATVIAAEEDAERFHSEKAEADPRVLTDQEQADQLAEAHYEAEGES
jgi:hypothetical protein